MISEKVSVECRDANYMTSLRVRVWLLFRTFVLLTCVTAEYTGRGELAELVADHVLGDIDGDELVPVMHSDGKADEIRRNHRGARPGLDCGFLA